MEDIFTHKGNPQRAATLQGSRHNHLTEQFMSYKILAFYWLYVNISVFLSTTTREYTLYSSVRIPAISFYTVGSFVAEGV